MKAVILAGGFGTRLSEETSLKPKPMVEIGDRPIIWHIMKTFSAQGVNDFIICCGYKSHVIKDFFSNYVSHCSSITFDFRNNETVVHDNNIEPWRVTLVDTGEATMTGGRLKRIEEFLKDEEHFIFTYGDGLADINIRDLVKFHKAHGKAATVTAVRLPERYGVLKIGEESCVNVFKEKPEEGAGFINGGFFVLNTSVLETVEDDSTVWEEGPLSSLASSGQLKAFKHKGFWRSMDTLNDKMALNKIWATGQAPWKLWDD